jgi:hypothetical protein
MLVGRRLTTSSYRRENPLHSPPRHVDQITTRITATNPLHSLWFVAPGHPCENQKQVCIFGGAMPLIHVKYCESAVHFDGSVITTQLSSCLPFLTLSPRLLKTVEKEFIAVKHGQNKSN